MPHARPMKCHLIFYFVDDIEIAGVLVIFYYMFDYICSIKPGDSSYGLSIVKCVSSSRLPLYRFRRKLCLHRMFSLSQGVLMKYSSGMFNYISVASCRKQVMYLYFFVFRGTIWKKLLHFCAGIT